MVQMVGTSSTGANTTWMTTNGGAPTALTPVSPYTVVGDLILWFHYSRASGGDETATRPTGFTDIFQAVSAGFGLWSVAYRWRITGDTTHTATVTNHTSGTSGESILETLQSWTDVDRTTPVAGTSSALSTWASSLNMGPISATGLPQVPVGGAVLVFGGRFENVTGQTILTGDGLTWQASNSYQLVRGDVSSGLDAGCVVQYGVNNTTSPITVTNKTITTTGTAQAGAGFMMVLNPPAAKVVGGIYPESNNKLGPFKDTNGNLYTLTELNEGDPRLAMRKSHDGGDTWLHMDNAGRPGQLDLESAWMLQDGTLLHLLMMRSGTNPVSYHTLGTSDHATTPDKWILKDEIVNTPASAPGDQTCALCRRSNGDLYAFYRAAPVGGFQRCAYRKKPSGGAWGAEVLIDTTASTNFTQTQAIVGANDLIHIFYKNDTTSRIWYKTLSTGDVLSSSSILGTNTTTDDQTMATPAAYVDMAGTERILGCWKRASDGFLVGVPVDSGTPGSEEAVSDVAVYEDPPSVSSFQTVATLVPDSDTDKIYALWSDNSTHDLQLAVRNGTWGGRQELLDARDIQIIVGNIFTHSAGNGGAKVLGIVYDDAQGLGRGQPLYMEHVISSASTFQQSLAGSVTPAGVLVKEAQKPLSGSAAPAGAVTKQAGKALAGSVSPGGALLKQVAKVLSGSVTPSGSVSNALVRLLSLAGSITSSGTLVRQTDKPLAGSMVPAGALVKQVSKPLTGSITPTGSASATRVAFLSLAGSIVPAGALVKRIAKTLAGSLTPTGSLLKLTSKLLGSSVTPSGSSAHTLDIPYTPAGEPVAVVRDIASRAIAREPEDSTSAAARSVNSTGGIS